MFYKHIFFKIDILSFTETWLNSDISTEDIMLQSYNTPERKVRPGDPHGGVMIYVKHGIFTNAGWTCKLEASNPYGRRS